MRPARKACAFQGRPRAPDAAAPLNAAAFLCGEGRDRQPMRRTDVHRVPDRTAPRSLAIPLFWMDMVVHLKCRGRVGFSRSDEHTSEIQSLMRHSYADFCL